MIYTALLLGLMGSIHCVGMCGPLVMTFAVDHQATQTGNLMRNIIYHLGRITSYAILGLIFGSIGGLFQVVDFQKFMSIFLGVCMILAFLFSIDIDSYIQKIGFVKTISERINKFIVKIISQSKRVPPYVLGLLNGILPCGLVYLALGGALASNDLKSAMAFMIFFGLGNAPVLIALACGVKVMPITNKIPVKRMFSFAMLFLGIIMIVRGININLPPGLTLIDALSNPVMCH